MTKYIDKTNDKRNLKGKKTVFKKFIEYDYTIKDTYWKPKDFKNVEFKGYENIYGDIFYAWNEDKNRFTIFFGEKGDEF